MFYRTMLSDGTVGGIYETTEVGRDGETARTRRVTGLTSSWTHVVPLREDLLLFYRQSDEYAVVVLWTDDGQALDQYQIHPLGLEWTHIVPVAPDRFLTYDADDGRAQLAIHNGETPVGGPAARRRAARGLDPPRQRVRRSRPRLRRGHR